MNNNVRRLAPSRGPIYTAKSTTTTPQRAAWGRYTGIAAAIKALRPRDPMHCLHPEALTQAATLFLQNFPGHALYAVKSNPDPYVLNQLYMAGIRHFDVASLGEIAQMRQMFPDAHLAYMHPVKGREAIRAAYFDYGVRVFVLDTLEELHKIQAETNGARDLTLVVRLGMPKGSAACSLSGKFGATPDMTVMLLKEVAKSAQRVGLSFHVGSQTLDPDSYRQALRKAGEVVAQAGVKLGVLDVGGGFPIAGLGMEILPLTVYFETIREGLAELNLPEGCEVWCEPGRALCGNGTTLVVRVELRKDDVLYINDGSFGNLFEVCSMQWRNDCQLFRGDDRVAAEGGEQKPFRFFGPTCDSVDYMAGPFMLPEDVKEGDWIALSGMGAYGIASRSQFNGFAADIKVEIVEPTGGRLVRLRPRRRETASAI